LKFTESGKRSPGAEDAKMISVNYLVKKYPEILMFQPGKENIHQTNWM